MPAAAPLRPAWATPTTPATGSAARIGTQSAVRTASPRPGVVVTTPSVAGTGPSAAASTTATVSEWTWSIQTIPASP